MMRSCQCDWPGPRVLVDYCSCLARLMRPVLRSIPLSFNAGPPYSGRPIILVCALSVVCGVITVGLVYWIGLRAFNAKTALWASWLCAVSPLMVYYSREARMYIWLVTITCVAWGLLFAHWRSPQPGLLALYTLSVIALVYSHPLGLLMLVALALATSLFHRAFQIPWRLWLVLQLIIILAVAPWIGRYLDHPPESTSGLLPIRYLLGMPIGFIGGDFWVLLGCTLVTVYGLFTIQGRERGSIRIALNESTISFSLLIWLIVPPVLLYAYSRVAYPIFGPARYTLFVGPAYLVLVARGLAKLPWALGITAASAGAIISGVMLVNEVYRPDLKADWRDLAVYLDQHDPGAPIAVISADTSGNMEIETARYYLEPGHVVIPWSDRIPDSMLGQKSIWVSMSLRAGQPLGTVPAQLSTTKSIREVINFSRLRLIRADFPRIIPRGN